MGPPTKLKIQGNEAHRTQDIDHPISGTALTIRELSLADFIVSPQPCHPNHASKPKTPRIHPPFRRKCQAHPREAIEGEMDRLSNPMHCFAGNIGAPTKPVHQSLVPPIRASRRGREFCNEKEKNGNAKFGSVREDDSGQKDAPNPKTHLAVFKKSSRRAKQERSRQINP